MGKWKVALEAGDKGSWEERVNRASVCKIDGKWLMWYTGQSRNNSAIGIATSDDGIRFTRMQQKPILVPSEPYEKGSVMNPCVLWDKDEKSLKCGMQLVSNLNQMFFAMRKVKMALTGKGMQITLYLKSRMKSMINAR